MVLRESGVVSPTGAAAQESRSRLPAFTSGAADTPGQSFYGRCCRLTTAPTSANTTWVTIVPMAIAVVGLVVVGSLVAALYALQDRMLFFPRPLVGAGPSGSHVESVEVMAEDGTLLRGWLVKSERHPAPLLVYFGGNAEEVSW